MRTKIEFLKDPKDGKRQVFDLISELRDKAETHSGMHQMVLLIMRGLEFLQHHGYPHAEDFFFTDTLENGDPYTIRLIKTLSKEPLIEFRINYREVGAFRIVFFVHYIKNVQILVMAKAVIKQSTYSKEFNQIVRDTSAIYSKFVQDPEHFININSIEGIEQNE
ncbi:hypothetical protein ACFQ3J_21005 [Paenibacillus provencensis]|uniref:Uncharacterized protein n=1 Tax=Paenibacillus provencensis TaxID=441151 RepID=A0ABW3QES0_9BACL